MIKIDLDNDINNLPQIAMFTCLNWNDRVKQVILKCEYGVFQNDEFTYGQKELQLLADNNVFVDWRGETVPEGTAGAMGEYDFFMIMIQQPIDLPAVIQNYMTKAKQQGKFV